MLWSLTKHFRLSLGSTSTQSVGDDEERKSGLMGLEWNTVLTNINRENDKDAGITGATRPVTRQSIRSLLRSAC